MKPAVEHKNLGIKNIKRTLLPPPPSHYFRSLATVNVKMLLLEHPWQYIITHAWSHFTNLLLDHF